jgi:hypothetical protein
MTRGVALIPCNDEVWVDAFECRLQVQEHKSAEILDVPEYSGPTGFRHEAICWFGTKLVHKF